MLERRTWEQFRETGLVWWVNRLLHVFGWVLVMNFDESGDLTEVYPARTAFRGFDEGTETREHLKLHKYLTHNAGQLEVEAIAERLD
jgi:hypothetical protein